MFAKVTTQINNWVTTSKEHVTQQWFGSTLYQRQLRSAKLGNNATNFMNLQIFKNINYFYNPTATN